MLAGAMDTLEPVHEATGNMMDQDPNAMGLPTLPWDAEWDLSFLGFPHDSTANGL